MCRIYKPMPVPKVVAVLDLWMDLDSGFLGFELRVKHLCVEEFDRLHYLTNFTASKVSVCASHSNSVL